MRKYFLTFLLVCTLRLHSGMIWCICGVSQAFQETIFTNDHRLAGAPDNCTSFGMAACAGYTAPVSCLGICPRRCTASGIPIRRSDTRWNAIAGTSLAAPYWRRSAHSRTASMSCHRRCSVAWAVSVCAPRKQRRLTRQSGRVLEIGGLIFQGWKILSNTKYNFTTNCQQLSSHITRSKLADWFTPSLSRYLGLHQMCSGFVP